MDEVVRCWARYGVDLPSVVAFLAMCALSWPANLVVRKLISSKFKQIKDHSVDLVAKLDMPFAATIGRHERILYILAVMIGQYALVSGWLVVKAFAGWAQSTDEKVMRYHHIILYGNVISLLTGLGLGALGATISRALHAM